MEKMKCPDCGYEFDEPIKIRDGNATLLYCPKCVPRCSNCHETLSKPHEKEKHIVDAICWNCGIGYFSSDNMRI